MSNGWPPHLADETGSARDVDPVAGPKRKRIWIRTHAVRDALVGVLSGIGAPAGALALRLPGRRFAVRAELRENLFFYLYELVGTCLIFGFAGFLEGRRSDRLREGRERYRELSERDDVTGLMNQRAFRDQLARAVGRSRQFREPVGVLIADVDSLKGINDRFGHSAGSSALLHVADAIRRATRKEDMACRWGGDEFAILMPGADAAALQRVATLLLEALRTEPLIHQRASVPVTVTVGGAWEGRVATSEALFEKADRALYSGKSSGGNCFRLVVG